MLYSSTRRKVEHEIDDVKAKVGSSSAGAGAPLTVRKKLTPKVSIEDETSSSGWSTDEDATDKPIKTAAAADVKPAADVQSENTKEYWDSFLF